MTGAMALYNHDLLKGYDPDVIIWSIRSFYIFASYAILIVRFIPDLRDRFLNYGARSSETKEYDIQDSALPRWFRIQFDPVLDWLADMTVPHSWFKHFYICSSLCSAYWIFAHLNVAHYFPSAFELSLTNPWEYRVMWARLLLQLQGLRRLYECVNVARPSRSRMWVGHYIIGIAFYVVTNIAIWIEPGKQVSLFCDILTHIFLSTRAKVAERASWVSRHNTTCHPQLRTSDCLSRDILLLLLQTIPGT